MDRSLLRTGEFAIFFKIWEYSKTKSSISIPTNVHVFPGVPHSFRRYKQLSDNKRWDEVMSDGIAWALSNPAPGPFEIKSK